MMRSLYSGVSGLRNHQTRMDVIGNNIANVNTTGYKASRTIFQDMYSQNIQGASAPGATTGGTNPQQVGLGMTLSTIDTLFTRSAAQVTGNTYDLMIENDGFFVVRNGDEEFFTRAGNFYFDKANNLVTTSGFYLQGYKAIISKGADAIAATPSNIQNTVLPDIQRAKVSNVYLDGASPNATLTLSDAAGVLGITDGVNTVALTADASGKTFTGTIDDVYVSITLDDSYAAGDLAGKVISTDATGSLIEDATDTASVYFKTALPGPVAPASGITVDLPGAKARAQYAFIDDPDKAIIEIKQTLSDGKTQTYQAARPAAGGVLTIPAFGISMTLDAQYKAGDLDKARILMDASGNDAQPQGSPVSTIAGGSSASDLDKIYVDPNLYNVSIDKNGLITGIIKEDGFITDPTTGNRIPVLAEQRVTIGQVVVSTFDNQQALEKVGDNLYRKTSNTGDPQYNKPGEGGGGLLNPGALEMSNVDLAQEFTDMIVTQRGFQANSRIITTSDTLLEELVNLKR